MVLREALVDLRNNTSNLVELELAAEYFEILSSHYVGFKSLQTLRVVTTMTIPYNENGKWGLLDVGLTEQINLHPSKERHFRECIFPRSYFPPCHMFFKGIAGEG